MYVIISAPEDLIVHIRFTRDETEIAAHQQVAVEKYGYNVQVRKPAPWSPRKKAAA